VVPVRAFYKILRVLAHLLRGLLTIKLRFGRLTPAQREAQVQVWAQRALDLMSVRLLVQGRPPSGGPLLLVANHVSWLDILAMHAACYCRFVSKADIKRWPLIGALATGAGTLYVERESRRDALRVMHHMAQSLRGGEVVAVFPEGTTGDGIGLLPFHANLLQAALSSGAPVQPMALQFFDAVSLGASAAPSYIGDESLFGSVWRTLSARGIVVRLNFGEPQWAQGLTRRQWAAHLQGSVRVLMQEPFSG
jgi:1-acyl-sn-glycerol-3-phosphate acyltransferase